MSSVLAKCALGLALLGWAAVANERLELVATSFTLFYCYAIAIFVLATAAMILLTQSLKDVIATRRADRQLVAFRAVAKRARFTFVALALAALGYIVLSTGGTSVTVTDWEAAGPTLRSALFAGFTIPALLAWLALLASSQAAV